MPTTMETSEVPASLKVRLAGYEFSKENCQTAELKTEIIGNNDRYKEAAVAAGVGAAVGAVTAAVAKAALCMVSVCKLPRDLFKQSLSNKELVSGLLATSSPQPTKAELLRLRTEALMLRS